MYVLATLCPEEPAAGAMATAVEPTMVPLGQGVVRTYVWSSADKTMSKFLFQSMKLFPVHLFWVRIVASGLNANDMMNIGKINRHNKYKYKNLTV